uniref:Bifunctional isocitrate dehydrogenase kinase/phosphatase n=1 Tax=Eiseniibacteriota bacterium TaxID=2212470 RepID=A0A832HZI4_UNCEI
MRSDPPDPARGHGPRPDPGAAPPRAAARAPRAPAPASPAEDAAALIADAFRMWTEQFRALTRHARGHFERADWHALQRDSVRRLDLYGDIVAGALIGLRGVLGGAHAERPAWTAVRAAYARRIAGRPDVELAETFFNSIVRRVFHTVGVDPAVEFVASDAGGAAGAPPSGLAATFECAGDAADAFRRALAAAGFEAPWEDLAGDAARLARALAAHAPGSTLAAVELVRAPFIRGKGAYLVGRARLAAGPDGAPPEALPLVIALLNRGGRVAADAALFTEDEVSVVFSFARSYFLVDAARPRELVDYLRGIMPRKPVAELWNAIGFHRHGKTELYRSLLRHLAATDERFVVAPGQRGMVMAVFTLPGFDVVFKVIRDRFAHPKTVTHEEVRARYRLVFRHDRAGRLVDAQEFEHLEFPAARFEPGVLEELLASCAETVTLRDGRVVIRHVYTERRLRPLDLYLREADPAAARDAVVDYGQALRDLAATNIFPGDMLLKNFGVSRHGRLIFYDYDELCPLTDCRFRDLPAARGDDEESAAEPWYFVGDRDIFPEEFRAFLGLHGELLEAFLAVHGELLSARFWRAMQDVHHRGEVLDIYPYRAARRLRPGAD